MKDLLSLLEVFKDWILMLLPYAVVSLAICCTPVFTISDKKVGLYKYIAKIML